MRLAAIRQAKGLSQRDLADMVGTSQPTIQRAEIGHPSAKLSTYIECAAALGVTLADIFDDDRSDLERRIVEAFRALPADAQSRALGIFDLVGGQSPKKSQ